MRGKRRQREQRRKKWWRIGAIAFGVVLLLFVCVAITVKLMISEAFLEEEIEASINSDVEIGKVKVSIFSLPARITLSDVTIAPKVSDRGNDARVEVERVDLRVSLFALLQKEVNVKSITVSGADITTTYREDGSTSVEDLFSKPGSRKLKDGSGTGDRDERRGGFNAFEQSEFVATLGSLKIEQSRASILLEKMGVQLLCSNLNIGLSEMRFNPEQLEETNTAHLTLAVDVKADSVAGWPYGEIFLSGEASADIFNLETGKTEPEIEGDFRISRDSWLNSRVPFITKAWNMLEVLEKVGVKITKLPERATFGRSEAVAAHYHRGKITLRKALSVWVGDWEIAVLDDSWLDSGTDVHEINGELLASKSASATFLKGLEKAIDFIPKELRPSVVKNVSKKLYRKDRLVVPVESKGDFSDPKIQPTGPIPDLIESAKKAGKKLLEEKAKGLLKGLLDRD